MGPEWREQWVGMNCKMAQIEALNLLSRSLNIYSFFRW